MKRSRPAATAGASARRDQRILSDGESRARPFVIHCCGGGVGAGASRAGAARRPGARRPRRRCRVRPAPSRRVRGSLSPTSFRTVAEIETDRVGGLAEQHFPLDIDVVRPFDISRFAMQIGRFEERR
jgi:hypothetical protein